MNDPIPSAVDGDEGWGVSTMTYRKIVGNLYHVKGDMPYDLQKYHPDMFKQIAGPFWWISTKWLEKYKGLCAAFTILDDNDPPAQQDRPALEPNNIERNEANDTRTTEDSDC